MKKYIIIILFVPFCLSAQVGLGTIAPKGMLDISSGNSGLVIPRVTKIEDVTDGNGNNPLDGTVVYDLSRNQTCFRINGSWICTCNYSGSPSLTVNRPDYSNISTYIKASNTNAGDSFSSMSISEDGSRLAVGATGEDSNATGINGNQFNNSASNSGAVYIFRRNGAIWIQEAYIKASNTESNDYFGFSLKLSEDGSRLAVGATGEDSNATGVNGNQSNNSVSGSGAVYIFRRSGTTWTQEAYIKASNPDTADAFGFDIDLSDDGSRLAVGAQYERSNATGVNGNQANNSLTQAGAVYVFNRSGTTWSQEAYIKASNTGSGDSFGNNLSINSDGTLLAVGARWEASNATGINGNQADNSATYAGAVYVFNRIGTTWTQGAYIKASNTGVGDSFGFSISLSDSGNHLAVGAMNEASNATGINGNQSNNSASYAGAVYVFSRSAGAWTQEAYIKASNTETVDLFGSYLDLSGDGARLVVGAHQEDSNARGINGNQFNNSASNSGAVYVYTRCGSTWIQESYIKTSNSETGDHVGVVSLSGNGLYLAIGTASEDSNATGINGNQWNNSAADSGAVYIIE
ncbi:MAG: FG-GAP repeat protein [Altibacter sp.]|uniref:hypothetical protein n=1 Tax=Altibacter sp. TaxID=2024823 RepID=UPI001D3E9053|nr:hypothetical protein [Altibacter sp.]MBZ0326733.1 FG-GAP repeat protein [Altibacter sp.]